MRRCLDTPYPGSHFFWKRYAPSSGTSNSRGSGENNGIAVAAAAATAAVNSNSLILHNMSKWKLEQLESHVQLLQDAKQPIPQTVALLLAEARIHKEK
mmetsp:Transcript_13088/g.19369  ORF Transcript_13088/g.19369 Transcript_13088/m.19369 type:complete len:98 (-) Transcript_13088:1314-1607(-)